MIQKALCSLTIVALLVGCAYFERGAPFIGPPRMEPADRAEAMNHFLLGMMHEAGGRFEEAAAALEVATAYDSRNPGLYVGLMQIYFRMQAYEDVARTGERAVALEPGDPSLWVVLGGAYLQLGQYEEAAEAFREVIRIDPDSPLGYEALILAEESTNDLVATLDIYDKLIEMRPDSATLRLQRGLTLVRMENPREARTDLAKALELDPTLLRARYLLGVAHLEMNENEEAAELLSTLVNQSPTYQGGPEHLAAALARTNRVPRAMQAINILFARGHAEPRHHIQAMYLNLRGGRYVAVERVEPPEQAPILSQLFRALGRRGRGTSYEDLVRELDGIDGSLREEVNTFLHDLFYLYGAHDTAGYFKAQLRSLHKDGASSRVTEMLLARCLIALDQLDEALYTLHATKRAHGPDAALHYYLASIYKAQDEVRSAEYHLKAALELDPDNPEYMNFLGYLYAEEDMKLDEAHELLQRALQLDPGNPYYLDSLGWVYYRMGDADRAIELIRQAIFNMNTDDAILRDHLGDAYLLRGDLEKAIGEWERAYRLDSELDGVKEKLKKHRQRLTGR